MGLLTIKVPDVGEGIAEAELTEWNVAVGDDIREDDVFASVMTDKATVEIPSSANGKVVWLGASEGDTIAIGADLIRIETDGNSSSEQPSDIVSEPASETAEPAVSEQEPVEETIPVLSPTPKVAVEPPRKPQKDLTQKPLASPSVRLRAREAGLDLRTVTGSGKAGIITHADIENALEGNGQHPAATRLAYHSVTETKIKGLRRKISERMVLAKSKIPHITIVEEIDVTALEELRERLNKDKSDDKPKLTLLPFLAGAMVKALSEQPDLNAHFDDEAGVLRAFGGVHIGIATQTENGLMVPVVKHCETMDLWEAAARILQVTSAARAGQAQREELSGSTITITSLGPLGAIATTPIINHPEVAIVGVNRIAVRPMWNGTEFIPRKMMNISCSFDHRVIDGWDAAVFVKRLKTLLETPALIFVES